MINKLNIYTNLGLNNFLNQLFPKHKIEFRKIDDLLKDDSADESGIIFQDTKTKTNKINRDTNFILDVGVYLSRSWITEKAIPSGR